MKKILIIIAVLLLSGCSGMLDKDALGNIRPPVAYPRDWTWAKVRTYYVDARQFNAYCVGTFTYRVDVSKDRSGCIKQWSAIISEQPTCYFAIREGLPAWHERNTRAWLTTICNGHQP